MNQNLIKSIFRANVLRSKDRLRNMHHYPRVDFMEMYVVNEGYRNFYHFINDKNIVSLFIQQATQ